MTWWFERPAWATDVAAWVAAVDEVAALDPSDPEVAWWEAGKRLLDALRRCP